ncbi:MAG: glycerophosphodiester phosphodiesterase [Chitinophagaceae bacterium]|nr:glycerophosphodiester phosphodiesterase [Chitinophagaceae bacterium]
MQVHGHRGCRGLMPENTLEAFQLALELGVDTLELDVCISKDRQVVVSHEPWFNHVFCTQPNGIPIDKRHEKSLNLYRMNYAEIQRFDCGMKLHPRFPEQKKIKTHKPLLQEVIALAEAFSKQQINYNIEIKYTKEGSDVFHPDAATFSDVLIELLEAHQVHKRTMIQCFNTDVLNYVHRVRPQQTLSYLVEEEGTVTEQLKRLGFMPQVYSPDFSFLTAEEIETTHRLNIQVIPWTVNEVEDMEKMIALGVDGIISDYPDRLIKVISGKL